MRNLPMRRYVSTHYALPCRNEDQGGPNKMVKGVTQGLVAIGASYIGLKVVLGISGLITSAVGFLLPLGALSAIAYGGWQWLKNM